MDLFACCAIVDRIRCLIPWISFAGIEKKNESGIELLLC